MPFLGQSKRTFVRDPWGVQKERFKGHLQPTKKINKIYLPLLVSIDDIYFVESENPKGWMAKVETGG